MPARLLHVASSLNRSQHAAISNLHSLVRMTGPIQRNPHLLVEADLLRGTSSAMPARRGENLCPRAAPDVWRNWAKGLSAALLIGTFQIEIRGSEVQILSPRPIVFNRLQFRKSSELSPWCGFCGCPSSSAGFERA
jgi:hypothetical protein